MDDWVDNNGVAVVENQHALSIEGLGLRSQGSASREIRTLGLSSYAIGCCGTSRLAIEVLFASL